MREKQLDNSEIAYRATRAQYAHGLPDRRTDGPTDRRTDGLTISTCSDKECEKGSICFHFKLLHFASLNDLKPKLITFITTNSAIFCPFIEKSHHTSMVCVGI